MKTVSIKHTYWDIAADIYFDDFNSEKSILPLSVPIQFEAAEEQTSGSVYGSRPGKSWLYRHCFDASFQGSSGGEPRYLKIQQCE